MPKFIVHYDRHMSTIGQEIDVSRTVEMEFDKKPIRKDFPRIEQMLENEFYRKFAKTIKRTKRLVDISYKIKKVVPVS